MIRKIAAAIIDERRLLVVRKRSSKMADTFILPGGKPEPGETDLAALERELQEELTCSVVEAVPYLEVMDTAVFESVPISAGIYSAVIQGTPKPSGEIGEIAWLSTADLDKFVLGSLITSHLVPALVHEGKM